MKKQENILLGLERPNILPNKAKFAILQLSIKEHIYDSDSIIKKFLPMFVAANYADNEALIQI